jgi:hypothetical protein
MSTTSMPRFDISAFKKDSMSILSIWGKPQHTWFFVMPSVLTTQLAKGHKAPVVAVGGSCEGSRRVRVCCRSCSSGTSDIFSPTKYSPLSSHSTSASATNIVHRYFRRGCTARTPSKYCNFALHLRKPRVCALTRASTSRPAWSSAQRASHSWLQGLPSYLSLDPGASVELLTNYNLPMPLPGLLLLPSRCPSCRSLSRLSYVTHDMISLAMSISNLHLRKCSKICSANIPEQRKGSWHELCNRATVKADLTD